MNNSTTNQQNNPVNKAKRAAYGKQWILDNKDKIAIHRKHYYLNNKDKISAQYKQYRKHYYLNNKDKIAAYNKQYQKQYRVDNKAAIAKSVKQYRLDNKSKLDVRRKQRLKTDLLFSIICKLRSLVTGAFKRIGKNKTARTEQLLGCSWIEAKAHFEQLFKEGMSWENHGEWHIDHIRPVASFKKDELHLMNHISNLQPLWAEENLGSKKVSDKIKWIL